MTTENAVSEGLRSCWEISLEFHENLFQVQRLRKVPGTEKVSICFPPNIFQITKCQFYYHAEERLLGYCMKLKLAAGKRNLQS